MSTLLARLLARRWRCVAAVLAVVTPALAQDTSFFRIGTGGIEGTYYPIGGLIASVVSSPIGSRPCEVGGSCGVPGLVAVVQSSQGSVENVRAIAAGEMESGFAQADVAYWAHGGVGAFGEGRPLDSLRSITSLYQESIHLVARADAGIESVRDLAGKRVSIDEEGSGTQVDARIVLSVYGLTVDDIEVFRIKPNAAIDMMLAGELDAFFTVAGYPASSVYELAESMEIVLVPIDGPPAAKLAEAYSFLEPDVIPADTYPGIGAVQTLGVAAQWLVGAEVDDELVYGITRALWHPSARALLDNGHPRARDIRPERALKGLAVPLHPGAERWYREAGLLAEAQPEPAAAPE